MLRMRILFLKLRISRLKRENRLIRKLNNCFQEKDFLYSLFYFFDDFKYDFGKTEDSNEGCSPCWNLRKCPNEGILKPLASSPYVSITYIARAESRYVLNL